MSIYKMNYCTVIPNAILAPVPRIIVIGDIHGDWAALKSALTVAGVTNYHNDWIGGDTHVVQVGDLVDRAVRGGSGDERSENRIISHLLSLKAMAQLAGGDVHLLLGNHELMNVVGDFRYVSPMGLTDFNGKRREAFRPGGRVAKQLACNANAVIKIGSWIFSHAGVTSEISKVHTIGQVNTAVRDHLLGHNVLDRDHPIMDLFWHRRYATSGSCQQVHSALAHWEAKNMAIGHTVQTGGINTICGTGGSEGLWKVDVGMSDAFGRCSDGENCIEVLEILNDGNEVNILRGKKTLRAT